MITLELLVLLIGLRALARESCIILSPLHLLSNGPRLVPASSTLRLTSAWTRTCLVMALRMAGKSLSTLVSLHLWASTGTWWALEDPFRNREGPWGAFPPWEADWKSGCKWPTTTADALTWETDAESPRRGAHVSGRMVENIASQMGLKDKSHVFCAVKFQSWPDLPLIGIWTQIYNGKYLCCSLSYKRGQKEKPSLSLG